MAPAEGRYEADDCDSPLYCQRVHRYEARRSTKDASDGVLEAGLAFSLD